MKFYLLFQLNLFVQYVNLLMQDPVEINARAVLNVFRLALNCGWEQTERNHIIDLTWDVIELNVNSYMEDYLLNGIIIILLKNV